MVGLLHHQPDNPLDFIDVCLERVREIGWKNVRWNTFVEETEGISRQMCYMTSIWCYRGAGELTSLLRSS